MTYTESKKAIDNIRNKNEVMFRMAISHLMDVGIKHLTDENVKYTCKTIMKQDDTHSIMTNTFQCDLVKMAAELAKIDHIHLLVYISHNVDYDCGQKEIGYGRLKQIAGNVMDWIVCDSSDSSEDYNTFNYYCHIDDEELEELGFGYMIPEEEKEEE